MSLALVACDKKDVQSEEEIITSEKVVREEVLTERLPTAGDETLFAKISPQVSGVDFKNLLKEDHALVRLYYSGFGCGGVVMGDFDGDGTRDLFFTGGAGKNGLFLQRKGRLKFENATEESGVSGGEAWSAGALAVDLEGDGDLDLVVTNYDDPPHIFINDGSGKFVERGRDCGFMQADAMLMPTVCDYDRDGDLDLFFVTNQLYLEGGRPATPPFVKDATGQIQVKPGYEKYFGLKPNGAGGFKMDTIGRPDYLFRNDGGAFPKFTEVSSAAGLSAPGFGLSATWFDFDADGWPDLHVGNDFSDPDRLYRNMGDGTFKDVARAAFPHCAWFSMGADAADVDGDGLDDLFCADMAFTTHYKQKVGMGQMGSQKNLLLSISPLQVMRNHLFLNTGLGPFREAGQLAGIAKSDWSWGVKFADLDLDGREDLFVANGSIRSFNHADYGTDDNLPAGMTLWERWEKTPVQREANLAFRNLGEVEFEKSAKEWGLDEEGVSHGIACGDLDGDGDPDLVVTNLDATVSVFENRSQAASVMIQLRGKGKNSVGIGARVEVEAGGRKQAKTLRPAGGYLTTSPAELIFGLGDADGVDRVTVTWPNGAVQEVGPLAAGIRHVIHEDGKPAIPAAETAPLFHMPEAIKGVAHKEQFFDDFAKQPLLPHKLSQLGRATSWGDIDGDGDPDLYHGSGRGTAGGIFKNDGKGNLSKITCPDLDADGSYEDAASALFDADGDGDLDLYVASGSYENDLGSAALQDRLYRNDGAGNFSRATALPELRNVGSCVSPSDVDGDGDLDLFVGSRVIPGQYPLPATSRLLINESNDGQLKFTEREGVFAEVGMITDAVWADLDGDGDDDLLLTQEWGPILIFKNDGEVLKNESTPDSPSGWWTRIKKADIDGDGDLDFAVGNFGLNTKYHANKEHPALIYYGDLLKTGSPRIVEAEFENETLFPIRGKSCSTAAMPQLAKRFESYHSFALAELSEIYPDGLAGAQKFSCDTLESGFLINAGSGKLTFQAFPRIAQLAPVQGFAFGDFDHDGHLDLAMVQNFYSPQFETGPYAGSVGLLLTSDGVGNFTPVAPRKSGLLFRSDPRSLDALDLDGDGTLDLLCPLNHAPMLIQRGNPSTR
ncbi:VCBS repeat-containing protein [Akkermansiaceae bacterium]|nr:VCBS repeat-containing protein [Akkermansiaceae bacterium]